MCGIVGAVAERNIVPVLVEGLRRLEYRGYDSAGIAVLTQDNSLGLRRTVGKVSDLESDRFAGLLAALPEAVRREALILAPARQSVASFRIDAGVLQQLKEFLE